MNEVIIKDYQPYFAAAYKKLNVDWILQYFRLEEHDLEQLDNPEPYIISKGGFILFAVAGDEVVGTCALIRTGADEFELAKMAVTPEAQGKQIGKKLGLAVLERARDQGATRVWLESNRRLQPALNLYSRLGFNEIPIGPTLYERADIKMEIIL